MKRIIFYMTVLFASIHVANAQSELRLSLAQAQELGLQNRFDVKASQYDVEVAASDIARKKQALLPDVRATGNVSYHPQIQGTLVPPGFGGVDEPSLLALGAKSISIYSLELRQPLYNPSLTTDIKLAKNAEALEHERKRAHDIEVKKQISYAYLNAQLRELQHRIATQEEKRYQEYFTLAEGRFKNGALIENDYLRAKLDYENAQQQAIISRQEYDLSLLTLHYELNVPASTKLVLTDSLESPRTTVAPVADLAAVENRTEVRQLQLEEQGNQLKELRQKQVVRPTLSFIGNYSQQYLNMDFNYNYTDSKWWSPFSAVGLQLSLPLTAQFTNRTSVQQARLRSKQTNLRQQQEKANATYEIQQAVTEIENALQNLQRTKSSYDLAQQVYKNQQQQLALGAFSYDNLLNTETSLTTAERNYITATYDYFVAKLNYDVATSSL